MRRLIADEVQAGMEWAGTSFASSVVV